MRHAGAANFVAFSPDRKQIASGGDDKIVRLWNPQTGDPVLELLKHDAQVSCGTYSPDGTRIVTGSYYGTLRVCNASMGTQIGETIAVRGGWHEIRDVKFSPDGMLLASCCM